MRYIVEILEHKSWKMWCKNLFGILFILGGIRLMALLSNGAGFGSVCIFVILMSMIGFIFYMALKFRLNLAQTLKTIRQEQKNTNDLLKRRTANADNLLR